MWDIVNGFVPRTFDEILATMVAKINEKYGTNYNATTIQATNLYKYFYAGIQVIMEAEQQVADLSGKYQQYIVSTNQKILQPRGTVDGFINFIKSDGVLNTEGSFEPIDEESKAGKIKFAILMELSDPEYANKIVGKDTNTLTDSDVLVAQSTFTSNATKACWNDIKAAAEIINGEAK